METGAPEEEHRNREIKPAGQTNDCRNRRTSRGPHRADDIAETLGVAWLKDLDISNGQPAWETSKRCYALGGSPSDAEVYSVMFGDEPYSAEFIAAFVSTAQQRLGGIEGEAAVTLPLDGTEGPPLE